MIQQYAISPPALLVTGTHIGDLSFALSLLQHEGTVTIHTAGAFCGILRRQGGVTTWL